MGIRLIIEGNAAYEIDEDCLACKDRFREKNAVRSTEKRGAGTRMEKGRGRTEADRP